MTKNEFDDDELAGKRSNGREMGLFDVGDAVRHDGERQIGVERVNGDIDHE